MGSSWGESTRDFPHADSPVEECGAGGAALRFSCRPPRIATTTKKKKKKKKREKISRPSLELKSSGGSSGGH